jgi:hypothetical protein
MVLFSVNYEAHVEGKIEHYVNYDKLKRLINDESGEKLEPSSFANHLRQEIVRVDEFFSKRVLSVVLVIDEIKEWVSKFKGKLQESKQILKVEGAALKRMMTKTFDEVVKIKNFSLLNRVAVIKLLKKYDKVHRDGADPLVCGHLQILESSEIGNLSRLDEIMMTIITFYADVFCDGLLEEAKGKLLLVKDRTSGSQSQSIAFKFGVLLVLFLWFLYSLFILARGDAYGMENNPVIYVYALPAALILFNWVWSFNVSLWDRYGIDYALVLRLDSAKHLRTPEQLQIEACNYSILFMINLVVFQTVRETLPANSSHYTILIPLALLIGTIALMLKSTCRSTTYGVFSWPVIGQVRAAFRFLNYLIYLPLSLLLLLLVLPPL